MLSLWLALNTFTGEVPISKIPLHFIPWKDKNQRKKNSLSTIVSSLYCCFHVPSAQEKICQPFYYKLLFKFHRKVPSEASILSLSKNSIKSRQKLGTQNKEGFFFNLWKVVIVNISCEANPGIAKEKKTPWFVVNESLWNWVLTIKIGLLEEIGFRLGKTQMVSYLFFPLVTVIFYFKENIICDYFYQLVMNCQQS